MILNELKFHHKVIASLFGGLSGSLLASGLGELAGISWNGGVWHDWAIAAFWIGLCLAFPLSLALTYSLVPLLYKKVSYLSDTGALFLSAGLVAVLVVLIPYSFSWLYILKHAQSILPTLPSMLILLSYSITVALLTTLFLYIIYKKYKAKTLPSSP